MINNSLIVLENNDQIRLLKKLFKMDLLDNSTSVSIISNAANITVNAASAIITTTTTTTTIVNNGFRSDNGTIISAQINRVDVNLDHGNKINDKNNVCYPHAPYEMLDEWQRSLFGYSIFITAIITFFLNLLVIIVIVLNKHFRPRKCSSSSISSSCFLQQHQINNSRRKSLSNNSALTANAELCQTNQRNIKFIHRCSVGSGMLGNSAVRRGSVFPELRKSSSTNNQINSNNNNNASHHYSSLTSTSMSASYSHTHQSFISLSISVIIYSSICVPAMYLETIDKIPANLDSIIIKTLRFLFYVAPIASSFMHLLMAFDRYLAIKQCFGFRSYWYRRHYTSFIVFLWIFSIMIVLPFFWYKHYARTMQIILTLLRLMLTFSIPSLLTLALYVSIAYELDRIRKETKIVTPFIQNNKLIVKHKNIIVKIIVLASIHFLCWFPFSVVESINDLFPGLFHQCDTHVQTYYCMMAILILITSMSGIAYPILYCFVSHEFRKMFRFKSKFFKSHKSTNQLYTEMGTERDQSLPLNNGNSNTLQVPDSHLPSQHHRNTIDSAIPDGQNEDEVEVSPLNPTLQHYCRSISTTIIVTEVEQDIEDVEAVVVDQHKL